MGQTGVGIALTLFLLIGSVSTVLGEAEPKTGQLSVELDIPNYIPGAGRLMHPDKFFSGHTIKIKGGFSVSGGVKVWLMSKNGERAELEVLRLQAGNLKTRIPLETPTGDYELRVTFEDKELSTDIAIEGLTERELKLLEQKGGGAALEEPLSGAILYTSRIECVFCYWESVLSGHPADSRTLVFQGGIGTHPHSGTRISNDGGRTWSFIQIPYVDPDVLVTGSGKIFISGINSVPAPEWWSDPNVEFLRAGGLTQGQVGGSELLLGYFNPLPESVVRKNGDLLADYPKMAYDDKSGTLYITAQEVFTEDRGYLDKTLFVSKDNGQSFSAQKLSYSPPYWTPVLSPFVNLKGELRALVATPRYNPKEDPGRTALLKFDRAAQRFQLKPGPVIRSPFFNSVHISTVSDRGWEVHTGPVMRLDRSSKHYGRIYIAWADPESETLNQENRRYYGYNHDIFLSFSDNDGESWSAPIKVNDDSTTADQVFPSLEVDSEGIVHVVFIDKRNTLETSEYDVYYTKVVDGEVSRNLRVNPAHISNLAGGREPGDYMDMLEAYPSSAYVSYPCSGIAKPYDIPPGICFSALDPERVPMPEQFVRGDANQDLRIDMADPIRILEALYVTGECFECEDASDANDDGVVDLSDAIYLLRWLFTGGPEPRGPFLDSGRDPTDDALRC